jgi:prepilin-type N-terminal cleavage/methylation domain-containing protein
LPADFTTLIQKEKDMRKNVFTLVEILIVVIILGILAAIVIPQFTEASKNARAAATTPATATAAVPSTPEKVP